MTQADVTTLSEDTKYGLVSGADSFRSLMKSMFENPLPSQRLIALPLRRHCLNISNEPFALKFKRCRNSSPAVPITPGSNVAEIRAFVSHRLTATAGGQRRSAARLPSHGCDYSLLTKQSSCRGGGGGIQWHYQPPSWVVGAPGRGRGRGR